MLETLTYSYTQQSGVVFFAVGFVAILLGGLVSVLMLRPREGTLTRSFYFMQGCAASFLLSANQIWWMFYVPALKAGLSGLLLLGDLLGCLLYGAFLIRIAQARSRDAYGNSGRAWFALVPIANLVLLFKPSQNAARNLSSSGAVVAGLVLILLSRSMTAALLEAVQARSEAGFKDPAASVALNKVRMRADGPEAGLDQIIAAEGAPTRIAPDLMLASVQRHGLHLTYDFRFDQRDADSLNDNYRKDVTARFCNNLLDFMQAGASVTLLYRLPDGHEVDRLNLTLTACTI